MNLLNNLAGWWARSQYAKISYRGTSKDTRTYFNTQIRQSIGKANKDAQFRYQRMIDHLLTHAQFDNLADTSVLCLGSRNMYELNALTSAGFGRVLGIDLFTTNPNILLMDMHHLNFPDQTFNVVYSGDSFEHAHTPRLVAQEVARVLRPNGYFCLSTPIMWRAALGRQAESISELADCQDFESKQQVYSYFSGTGCETIHDEMYTTAGGVSNLLALLKKGQ